MGPEMARKYKYEPLPIDEYCIRLLKILPENDTDVVKLSLKTVRLSKFADRYKAISYMWGPDNDDQHVWVDDHYITVRNNIWRFLRHYRKHFIQEKISFLWIDSICIAQHDLSEKSMQVAGMGRVFSSAHQVLVWLGESSEKKLLFKKDIEFVRRTYWQAALQTDSSFSIVHGQVMETSRRIIDIGRIMHSADRESANRLCLFARKIMHHAYWGRLWVVQEVKLARGGPRVIQGSLLLSSDVMGVIKYTVPTCPKAASSHDAALSESFFNLCPDVYGFTNSSTYSLSTLLRLHHHQSCSDPRDRIYGLISLVKPGTVATRIKFDYGIDLWHLLLQTLDVFLQEEAAHPRITARTSHLDKVDSLARTLNLLPSDISTLCEKSTSDKQNISDKSLASSSSLQGSVQDIASTSSHLLVLRYVNDKLDLALPAPRLHVRQYNHQSSDNARSVRLAGIQSHDKVPADLMFDCWKSWLRSSLHDPLILSLPPNSQLWISQISGNVSLAFRPLLDGNLQVAGWTHADCDDLNMLPIEVYRNLQDEVDENIRVIKNDWMNGQRSQVPLSILTMMQLGRFLGDLR